MTDTKERIFNVISDSISDILFYDRKESEYLLQGEIELAIEGNIVSVDEIVAHFRAEFIKGIK